jgi:hypothetical protein
MNLRRLLAHGWLPHVFVAGGPRPPHHLRAPVFADHPRAAADTSFSARDPAVPAKTPVFAPDPAVPTGDPIVRGRRFATPDMPAPGATVVARDPAGGDTPLFGRDPAARDTPLFAGDPAVGDASGFGRGPAVPVGDTPVVGHHSGAGDPPVFGRDPAVPAPTDPGGSAPDLAA